MALETFIICVTVYLLIGPLVWAKAYEMRERARQLEIENDMKEFD